MAKHYVTADSKQGVQVLSQTQVQQVQFVGIYTKPHNSYMQVPVPLSAWQGGNAADYLEPPAANLEKLWSEGLITATGFVQTTDSSGLLTSYVAVTVTLRGKNGAPTQFSTIVSIPLVQLAGADFFGAEGSGPAPSNAVLDAYTQLTATAKL